MTVISVEHVSKAYRLGMIGGATLKEDFGRWWAKLRRRPDPLLKVGQEHHQRRVGEQFWALDEVSFEVEEGEVLGIIGRNGAGKSTLLKILSQVTAPSSGEIRIKGRIASLLEVGTGFHPELTGRENIFLNGAILGMNKAEISRKLDEIIEFSGVEEFIDTPVKRYSSGMYVRLAFAVAAHLEPEILIVDEVLAVGDAEFQKKCLGKMQSASAQDGRTVIFVSHSMPAVRSLCTRAILMDRGTVAGDGAVADITQRYLSSSLGGDSETRERTWSDGDSAPGNEDIRIRRIAVVSEGDDPDSPIEMDTPFRIEIDYWNLVKDAQLVLNLYIDAQDSSTVLESLTTDEAEWFGRPHPVGLFRSTCLVPPNLLNAGKFSIRINFLNVGLEKLLEFDKMGLCVQNTRSRKLIGFGRLSGYVHPQLEWRTALVDRR